MSPACETDVKLGDCIGIGAHVFSCGKCSHYEHDNVPYYEEFILTYNQTYPDRYLSQGGYASQIRVHEQFAIPIPKYIPTPLNNPSYLAAPLLVVVSQVVLHY